MLFTPPSRTPTRIGDPRSTSGGASDVVMGAREQLFTAVGLPVVLSGVPRLLRRLGAVVARATALSRLSADEPAGHNRDERD